MYNEISPELLWYMTGRDRSKHPYYDISKVCDPLIRTPEPSHVKGAFFDERRVDEVVKTLGLLKHTQGKYAGRPLTLEPWQIAHIVGPIFGWCVINEDGQQVRIIRKLFMSSARKSGKTTLGAAIAMYMTFADHEAGAQTVCVAASKDQAGHAYKPLKLVAEHSPALREAGIKPLQTQILGPDGSYIKSVASVADTLHGANLSCALVDEIWAHKDGDLLEAVETGMQARSQPLTFIITTPDSGAKGSETVYARQFEMIGQLAKGVLKNPAVFGVVWSATEDQDPFDEETWKLCSPNYGVSVNKQAFQNAATEARQSPIALSSFQRLYLGMRTKQEYKTISMDIWDRNASIVDEHALKGRECFGGLDLASTSDLTAFTLVFPDREHGGYDALFRIFIPEGALPGLDHRTQRMATEWVKRGIITVTPGDVVDYGVVKAQILKDRDTFNLREVAYDRWNATSIVTDLDDEKIPLAQFGQGFASMSAPTKELIRLLGEGTAETPLIRHGGNPCVRWQADNLSVMQDPAGNIKPDKKTSSEKIDSIVALIMALERAVHSKPIRRSFYDTLLDEEASA